MAFDRNDYNRERSRRHFKKAKEAITRQVLEKDDALTTAFLMDMRDSARCSIVTITPTTVDFQPRNSFTISAFVDIAHRRDLSGELKGCTCRPDIYTHRLVEGTYTLSPHKIIRND
jgi:hypothetical protein